MQFEQLDWRKQKPNVVLHTNAAVLQTPHAMCICIYIFDINKDTRHNSNKIGELWKNTNNNNNKQNQM